MVTSDEGIEPIVPMGILVSRLGCKVTWVGEQLQVEHPRRGRLEVDVHLTGCPQISRNLALELIDEPESAKKEKKVKAMTAEMKSDLTSWMVQLVDAHPVLRELPEWLRCRLAVEPGSWNFLPGNARMRKRWQERGVLVHLYAGPDEGFTLRRALHQVGGTEAADDLLEIDILRGGDHDMLSDDGVYAGLIRAMLDGKIKALVAGPNCRTRSVLRHRPLPSGRPRPVRGWGGHEYGLPGLDSEEVQMLRDDDVMMWRTIFLYMIGKYLSKASGNDPAFPKLMIEQPATPKEYRPETVSFWDTVEWEMLKGEFAWTELTLNQGDHGGQAVKPTTFGGDLELHPGTIKPRGRFEDDVLRRDSKRLARWAPGVMTMVAKALQQEVREDAPRC